MRPTVTRQALLDACTELLQPARFKDYGPNGLQVEGSDTIRHIVSGVTASRALIEAAIDAKADAIFVHHGLFWRGQDGTVTGWMKQRLQLLLAHNINVLAYHLPLDAHPELGNNAQLGKRLGLQVQGTLGEQDLVLWGTAANGQSFVNAHALADVVSHALGRSPVVVQTPEREIRKVAWCTGGAQGYFDAAIAAGVDAFLTGEISEPQAHLARETGVAFLACGHHATERYGVKALGEWLYSEYGLDCEFVDIDNPA